jgi:hypothetical protein
MGTFRQPKKGGNIGRWKPLPSNGSQDRAYFSVFLIFKNLVVSKILKMKKENILLYYCNEDIVFHVLENLNI